jgi:hypothetical protein
MANHRNFECWNSVKTETIGLREPRKMTGTVFQIHEVPKANRTSTTPRHKRDADYESAICHEEMSDE